MYTNIKFISVAAVSAMLLTACSKSDGSQNDGHHDEMSNETHAHEADVITMSKAQMRAANLQTETIAPSDFSSVIEVSGQVLPATGTEATVTATMAGIVRFSGHALTEGAAVSNGQALFTVNAQSMADGNPAAAAQSELKAAREEYERAKQLAAESIISGRELSDARRRYETAESSARSLGCAAQVRTLAAPMAGYVKTLLIRPGDYVAAGQAVAVVTQSRRLQLRADVPERYFSRLSDIVSANFRMAYDAQRTYTLSSLNGRLVSKGRAADTDDNFVPVIFEFDNRGDIVSGSFAEIYLKGAKRANVISVPNAALTEAQGLHFVYVEEHEGEYRRIEVSLGATDGERTEIVSGLKSGDRVVTRGATQVRLAASGTAVPEGHHH